MSRNRNRSVKTLPRDFENILVNFNKSDNKLQENNLDCFGENIQDNIDTISPKHFSNLPLQKYFSNNSDTETTDSITLDLNKLSGLSSSSSLSWSDEYEYENTKKVQEELKKIDRVLRGEVAIPSNYDREEFEEWMGTFPNISIFDSEVTPVNSTQNIFESVLNEEEKEETNTVDKTVNFINKDCNICTCNNKTTLTVIDISSSSMKPNQRSANTARKRKLEETKSRSRNIFTISHKPRGLDTDKYLKISSLKSQVYDRKPSSRSLLLNAVDHKEEGSRDYISLPCIKIEDSDFSRKKTRVCAQNLRNLKQEILHKKSESSLVLPPILTTNQFRSVSATPRQTNKIFSALSMKLDSHFKENKSRKSSIRFLANPISNR